MASLQDSYYIKTSQSFTGLHVIAYQPNQTKPLTYHKALLL